MPAKAVTKVVRDADATYSTYSTYTPPHAHVDLANMRSPRYLVSKNFTCKFESAFQTRRILHGRQVNRLQRSKRAIASLSELLSTYSPGTHWRARKTPPLLLPLSRPNVDTHGIKGTLRIGVKPLHPCGENDHE